MTAPVTLHDRPIPVQFEPPLQSPAPLGLYAATTWTEIGADQPSRHLNGVEVRPGRQLWRRRAVRHLAQRQLRDGHRARPGAQEGGSAPRRSRPVRLSDGVGPRRVRPDRAVA